MSLEFAEKIIQIRKAFNFTKKDLADLLDIDDAVVYAWEALAYKPADCWERVIQFLIDCPSSALQVLGSKPWINEDIGWPDRISDLRKKLGWTNDRLAEFLSTTVSTMNTWTHINPPIKPCFRILLSLLEIYSEVDPKEWPPALYFQEEDVITPERIKLLRLGLGMKQSQFANLIHINQNNISTLETGSGKPGWCANLLLRMLETYPRSADLLEKIPWGDEKVPPERAAQIRMDLGLTRLELARLLGATQQTINLWENHGRQGSACAILVYQLLEQHPEEFLSYIESLSNPGGQACPIW